VTWKQLEVAGLAIPNGHDNPFRAAAEIPATESASENEPPMSEPSTDAKPLILQIVISFRQ
jgi:hypothetical protein